MRPELSSGAAARRLQKRLDNGALAKLRIDDSGIASMLYETELKPAHKIALAAQFDATDLNKPPKVRARARACRQHIYQPAAALLAHVPAHAGSTVYTV
jgi:hypothetical protein